MGRIDALIALVAGSTLAGFVGFVGYALLTTVGVFSAGSVAAGDGGGYGTGEVETSSVAGTPTYERRAALVDGQTVGYLDFGNDTPLLGDRSVPIAPIWVFVDGFNADGTPRMSSGRPSVLDVVPGDAGYSDLWDVQFVVVPDGFDTSPIRSLTELQASGLEVVPSGMLVNCPLVDERATTSEGHTTRPGWYRGELVYYFDLGVSATIPGDVYEFVVAGSDSYGYGSGAAVLLSVPPLVVQPSADGPAAQFFRRHEVTVENAEQAASIRTFADLEQSGLAARSTGELLNRPLIANSAALH